MGADLAWGLLLMLALVALVVFFAWAWFTVGWRGGRRKMRQELGIAGQRQLKRQEWLVNEAHDLLEGIKVGANANPAEDRVLFWLTAYDIWDGE